MQRLSPLALINLVLLAAIWLLFAPIQLGGKTAFVIVNGISMEPVYHRGDLVMLRAADDYHIGDIVTYRHPQIGPVIHRILQRDGDDWVFKGDNNSFIDPYHPHTADLIGRAWIAIPSIGSAVTLLRAPFLLALLAAGAGVFAMTTRNRSRPKPGSQRRRTAVPAPSLDTVLSGLSVAALCALGFLALALWTMMQPATHTVTDQLAYTQGGTWQYRADAPAGIYDTTSAETGEPIFSQLSRALNLSFAYHAASDLPTTLHGSARLDAELSSADGWRRSFVLQPEHLFSGADTQLQATIDLAQIQTLITTLEQRADLPHREYLLTIRPTVTLDGTLAAQPLHERFDPRLVFRVDDRQLQVVHDDAEQNSLSPLKRGALAYAHDLPSTLNVLGLKLPLSALGPLAGGGLLVALLALLALGLSLRHAVQHDATRGIGLKYGRLIITTDSAMRCDDHTLALATIDDVARVAERAGAMLVHHHTGDSHRYSAQVDGRTYYFDLAHGAAAARPRMMETNDQLVLTQPSAFLTGEAGQEWHAVFLATLRETGMITEAGRVAGVRLVHAYQEREHSPAFARAWSQARNGACATRDTAKE